VNVRRWERPSKAKITNVDGRHLNDWSKDRVECDGEADVDRDLLIVGPLWKNGSHCMASSDFQRRKDVSMGSWVECIHSALEGSR